MILLPPTSTLFPYTTLFRSLFLMSARRMSNKFVGRPIFLFSVSTEPSRRTSAPRPADRVRRGPEGRRHNRRTGRTRSEEHTSELQSRRDLVCRLLLEKKKKQ